MSPEAFIHCVGALFGKHLEELKGLEFEILIPEEAREDESLDLCGKKLNNENEIENLIVKYEDKSQDILDMVKYARHIHVAGDGNNIDTCKKCGHDIRHGIHFRYGENINEYTKDKTV